jgi:hypothetical protein
MGHDEIIASVKLLNYLTFDSAVMRHVLNQHERKNKKYYVRVANKRTN